MYLVMQNGDTKKGAGLQVRLLRHPDSVTVALAANCLEHKERYDTLDRMRKALPIASDAWMKVFDEIGVEFDRATSRANAIVAAYTVAETGTGMNAHYVFKAVTPGTYRLHAMFHLGERYYQWLTPINISAAASWCVTSTLQGRTDGECTAVSNSCPTPVGTALLDSHFDLHAFARC